MSSPSERHEQHRRERQQAREAARGLKIVRARWTFAISGLDFLVLAAGVTSWWVVVIVERVAAICAAIILGVRDGAAEGYRETRYPPRGMP